MTDYPVCGIDVLESLLARDDVEDICFEGCGPTTLRLVSGELVTGPPISSTLWEGDNPATEAGR